MDVAQIVAAGGIIVTVLLAYVQMQKSQRATLEAQERSQRATLAVQEAHLKNQLKVRIYEHSTSTFEQASDLLSKSHVNTISVVSTLRMAVEGLPFTPGKTVQELADAHYAAAGALSAVLRKLEQYEIAFARFGSIRRGLAQGHQMFLEAFSRLSSKLALYLPNTHPDTGAALPSIATLKKEDLPGLEQLQKAYADICGDMVCYILDLQIEAQNELLGSLFDHELPPRHPKDTNVKVLTRDTKAQTKRSPGNLV